MKKIVIISAVILCSLLVYSKENKPKQKAKSKITYFADSSSWNIEIPIWIPGFRGEFAYGEAEIVGGPIQLPETPSFGDAFQRFFKTKLGVNYVFLTSVSYEKKRFVAELDLVSGTLGSDIQFKFNNASLVKASIHTDLMRINLGFNLYQDKLFNDKAFYKFYAYSGIRMYNVKVSSDPDHLGQRFSVDPFWAEPVLGLSNDLRFKYFKFRFQYDMGSFGINDRFSYMLNFYAYYRLSKLLSIKFGWNDLYFNYTDLVEGEDLKLKLHMAGPVTALVFHL